MSHKPHHTKLGFSTPVHDGLLYFGDLSGLQPQDIFIFSKMLQFANRDDNGFTWITPEGLSKMIPFPPSKITESIDRLLKADLMSAQRTRHRTEYHPNYDRLVEANQRLLDYQEKAKRSSGAGRY